MRGNQGNSESVSAYCGTRHTERVKARKQCLDFIRSSGEFGATSDEISKHYGVFHNRVAPRVSELKKLKLIVDSGVRRKTRLLRNAAVYVHNPNPPKGAVA